MNIALISHDSKKILMENLCIAYRQILSKHELFSTSSTGTLIQETSNLNVNMHLAGHLGGQQQLASQIINNEIDLLIFFRDANAPISSKSESLNIFRLCDVYNIPFASNLATAEALLLALDRGDLAWREIIKR